MEERIDQVPASPRLRRSEEHAWQLLLSLSIGRLPVLPLQIYDRLSRYIFILPWTQAKKVLRLQDPFCLKKIKAEARTEKYRDGGEYMVIWDDTLPDENRQRFTQAHELGHILLGHFTDFKKTADEMTQAERDVLNKEADRFAAELLCPSPFFRYLPQADAALLKSSCRISDQAAERQMWAINQQRAEKETLRDRQLFFRLYDTFLQLPCSRQKRTGDTVLQREEQLPTSLVCASCGAYILGKKDRFCVSCGERRRQSSATLGHWPFMLPSFLPFCPSCLNEELREGDEYCCICGMALHNRCQAEGRVIPAGARYCPVCGGPAAYLPFYREQGQAQNRLRRYPDNDRWKAYPHAEALRFFVSQSGNIALASVLFYTKVMINAEGDLLLLAPSARAAEVLKQGSQLILQLTEQDTGKRGVLGAYSIREGERNNG